jgi:D-arabinose 1-dehydrogenase-like Zn-dependent alcohol dehydrogenase
MTTQETKRKLTAILSADVKGYSRLMGYNADDPFEINSRLLVSKELKTYGSQSCGRNDLQASIDLVSSFGLK